jgi:hypothetical protein
MGPIVPEKTGELNEYEKSKMSKRAFGLLTLWTLRNGGSGMFIPMFFLLQQLQIQSHQSSLKSAKINYFTSKHV